MPSGGSRRHASSGSSRCWDRRSATTRRVWPPRPRCVQRWPRSGAAAESCRRLPDSRRSARPPSRAADLTSRNPTFPHGIRRGAPMQGYLPSSIAMASEAGDGLNQKQLDAQLDPRLLRALDMVAPGTALREGIDGIIHARTGGLILLADPEEVSFLLSGGIKLDVDYNPALLYQ